MSHHFFSKRLTDLHSSFFFGWGGEGQRKMRLDRLQRSFLDIRSLSIEEKLHLEESFSIGLQPFQGKVHPLSFHSIETERKRMKTEGRNKSIGKLYSRSCILRPTEISPHGRIERICNIESKSLSMKSRCLLTNQMDHLSLHIIQMRPTTFCVL